MNIKHLIILLSITLSTYTSAQTELTPTEERIRDTVNATFDDEIDFLEHIVNINSGTRNLAGVKANGDEFGKAFAAINFNHRWIDMPADMDRAGHFVADQTFGDGPRLLLMGHLDTVFPLNSPFQRFEKLDDSRIKGPGITDMKDGNTVILFALKALSELDLLKHGRVTVFFTGDEESVGRPIETSRGDLIEIAKHSDIALNFEGSTEGLAVIGRRGSSGWTLNVSAKRAHSSGIFRDEVGAGAIFEAARILDRFYAQIRGEYGLTFNPGVIAGGTFIEQGDNTSIQTAIGKSNVVAQTTTVHGGLRFLNDDQLQRARTRMRGIVEDTLPGTESNITFTDSYPAMEATESNQLLLGRLSDITIALGKAAVKPFPPEDRGAADISFVAPVVTSMDGLGGSGGGAHDIEEWVDIESVRFATVRTAILLNRLLKSD